MGFSLSSLQEIKIETETPTRPGTTRYHMIAGYGSVLYVRMCDDTRLSGRDG